MVIVKNSRTMKNVSSGSTNLSFKLQRIYISSIMDFHVYNIRITNKKNILLFVRFRRKAKGLLMKF